jgi:hypothetical protein
MIVPCNEEVEMSVCEQLCMQYPDFQLDGILKLMPMLLGVVLENNDT